MEDETFSQMHHLKCGEGLLLYNHMHKFKHILCEEFKFGGSAILYYAGLKTPVSYCFNLIWFDLLLHWSGCSTILVYPLDVEYVIHLVVNICIICKHVDRQYYSSNYSCTVHCQLIDSHNIYIYIYIYIYKNWSL